MANIETETNLRHHLITAVAENGRLKRKLNERQPPSRYWSGFFDGAMVGATLSAAIGLGVALLHG